MADNLEVGDHMPQVAFEYIKGQLFRVVHADGATGGVAPNGGIHMAFFSERLPIPQREVHVVNSDGSLGKVIREQSLVRSAIVREMDFGVVMSVAVAEALVFWLQDRITEAKSRTKQEGDVSQEKGN